MNKLLGAILKEINKKEHKTAIKRRKRLLIVYRERFFMEKALESAGLNHYNVS